MSPILALLTKLPAKAREEFILGLTDSERLALMFDWRGVWARPSQIEPAEAFEVWLVLAGRGFGKTRTGGEWVRENVENGSAKRIALVAATASDYRDVMIEGESGILALSRPDFMPVWEPSLRRVTWPNGAVAMCYAAETPNRLRGPQHDLFWADEAATWKYPRETWDNLQFGLRLGKNPRGIVTTTPRPIALIRDLVKDPGTVVTGGSTYENLAHLAPKFIRTVVRRYEGTTVGRQELHAELLSEVPGALWKRKQIDSGRIDPAQGTLPAMLRIVVAIDPAVTSGEDADATGIIVAGLGTDYHGYVLWDSTMHATPDEWAREAVRLYHRYQADAIVAEVNNGGDLVAYTLSTIDSTVPVYEVHASRGKRTRAEPVSALYEQGKVHHLKLPPRRDQETGQWKPILEDLEDQLCTWTTKSPDSPDRLDAMVWALTALMLEEDGVVMEYQPEYEISPL